jgi:hypothetical protein
MYLKGKPLREAEWKKPHLLHIRITIYRALPNEDDGMALMVRFATAWEFEQ